MNPSSCLRVTDYSGRGISHATTHRHLTALVVALAVAIGLLDPDPARAASRKSGLDQFNTADLRLDRERIPGIERRCPSRPAVCMSSFITRLS